MRSEKIRDAYRSVLPDAQTRDRLLAQVLSQDENTRPQRHPIRTAILIAACAALFAGLAAGGYAAYQRWRLPKPESYSPEEQGYHLDVHSKTEYNREDIDQAAEIAPLSDEAFIEKAVDIFELVGKTDVDTGKMTVVRQENLPWAREEAVVRFTETETASVTFNADTGALIMLTDFDWEGSLSSETPDGNAAEAMARYYYGLLPVPQGYELKDMWINGDCLWTYNFCRRVNDDLFNEYEMVRICVNPFSGNLCALTVFDVPLLDDHEPGDVPLTQDQAEEIAVKHNEKLLDYTLELAEVMVVMPNWNYTEYDDESYKRYSNVSRLAWVLDFSREINEDGYIWEDKIMMYIDYYTGEILGGYASK